MKFNSKYIYRIINIIESAHGVSGTFFSAKNVKKDNSIRNWSCRLGVKSHLRGGPPAYDAEERNFITVWDSKAKSYRQLNISTLTDLKVCGEVIVKDGEPTDVYNRNIGTAKTMTIVEEGSFHDK